MSIETPEELERWLMQQPQEVCTVFAARAALRAFPFVTHAHPSSQAERQLTLSTARAIINSLAAAKPPPATVRPDVSAAAFAARAAARAAADASLRPADYAAEAAVGAADNDKFNAIKAANLAAAQVNHDTEVFAAIYSDTKIPISELYNTPIWDVPSKPPWLASALTSQKDMLLSGVEWAFWREWYQGFLDGNPMDWELQRRVALIDEAIWEAGTEAVAGEIERIRDEFERERPFERPASVPEIEKKTLVQHVRRLLENPEISKLSATGTADAIDKVIADYKRDAPANCLPEELEHLEELPALYRAIAKTFRSLGSVEKKEAKLVAQIVTLNEKVARLEAELKAAKEKTLSGRFNTKAIDSLATTIGSAWFLGALGLGTCHFFGLPPSDITYENLRGYISDLLDAAPAPEIETTSFPDVHDA